jgi:hypothetical protein
VQPEEELAASLRRSTSYVVHVIALIVGTLAFVGGIFAMANWTWGALVFVASGLAFCTAGVAALAGGKSAVTPRGGYLVRSLLGGNERGSQRFERINAALMGTLLVVWGLSLFAWVGWIYWYLE